MSIKRTENNYYNSKKTRMNLNHILVNISINEQQKVYFLSLCRNDVKFIKMTNQLTL